MMSADTMVTYPIKQLAAAQEKFARPERTVANELPQELSRLPEQYGFNEVNSFLNGGNSVANGDGRKKAGRPVKAAAVPRVRKRAAITIIGFTDDCHPTILAATRG